MHNGGRNTDTGFTIRPAQARELRAVLDLLKRSRLPEAGLAPHAGSLLVALDGDRIHRGQGLGQALTQSAGYTLIETAMAIAVLGIVLSFAWLRMGPAMSQSRVRGAATVLAADLQYAQMLAIRQRRPVAVIVDNSVRSYIIRLRDTAVTFRDRFLGQDTEYRLDSLRASPASVVLLPSGVVTSATTTFTLRRGAYTRHVRLTRAGQVRILP
jgi:prepilin-type N-terminal cleavage/methylation domain-containing protein